MICLLRQSLSFIGVSLVDVVGASLACTRAFHRTDRARVASVHRGKSLTRGTF